MKIKEIVSALERFAPLPLQDGFDNAGLQVGLTEAEATGALLCLDFKQSSHFGKCFKEKTGYSPKDYRNKQK